MPDKQTNLLLPHVMPDNPPGGFHRVAASVQETPFVLLAIVADVALNVTAAQNNPLELLVISPQPYDDPANDTAF